MNDNSTKWLRRLFFAAIVLLSGFTSAMFFVETFSLGRGLLDDGMTMVINAAVGLLLCDVAAIVWLRIRQKSADNQDLRTLSLAGLVLGISATIVTSIAYLLISTDALEVNQQLQDTATYFLIGAAISHFLLVMLYGANETKAREESQVTDAVATGNEKMLEAFADEYQALAGPLAADKAREKARAEAERIFGSERVRRLYPAAQSPQLEAGNYTYNDDSASSSPGQGGRATPTPPATPIVSANGTGAGANHPNG